MTDEKPFELKGFEPMSRIGGGGFGDVWLARQVNVDRKVAIKVGHAPIDDKTVQLRFERECIALGRLSGHPNIIDVFTAGQLDDERPYLVLEFVNGGTLWQRLQRGPLSETELCRVGRQLGDALTVAHDAGVLHRDLKPENILLRSNGDAVLGDFGIARLHDGANTTSHAITASVAYAAPEILSGKSASVASDLYGIGVCLLASILRSVPFVNKTDESIHPIINRVLTEESPDLRASGLSKELAAAITALLHKDPDDRPPNAAAARELFVRAGDAINAAKSAPAAVPPLGAAETGPLADKETSTPIASAKAPSATVDPATPSTGVPGIVNASMPPAPIAAAGTTGAATSAATSGAANRYPPPLGRDAGQQRSGDRGPAPDETGARRVLQDRGSTLAGPNRAPLAASSPRTNSDRVRFIGAAFGAVLLAGGLLIFAVVRLTGDEPSSTNEESELAPLTLPLTLADLQVSSGATVVSDTNNPASPQFCDNTPSVTGLQDWTGETITDPAGFPTIIHMLARFDSAEAASNYLDSYMDTASCAEWVISGGGEAPDLVMRPDATSESPITYGDETREINAVGQGDVVTILTRTVIVREGTDVYLLSITSVLETDLTELDRLLPIATERLDF